MTPGAWAPMGIAALLLAAPPAVLFLVNLRAYRPPPAFDPARCYGVSLLIPARNEEATITAALDAALATRGVDLEVVVLDDGSTDATAERVRAVARRDPRVRLATSGDDGPDAALPPGWCGKPYACWRLAAEARHDTLAWIDADVRLAPRGLHRLAAFLETAGAGGALVSGVPHQETGTTLERLLIPLIHFVLLGFLPLERMRRSRAPAYGAGCGQLLMTTRDAYARMGGHAAIKGSLHDGITLPRAYRRAGLTTDLCDATDLASCRMYRGAAGVWRGLSKNAAEGMASPAAIVPWTLILVGGQVLPVVGLITAGGWAVAGGRPPLPAVACLTAAAVLTWVAAGLRAHAFRQSWVSAVFHPLGVLLLVAIQWHALLHRGLGRPATWRGRVYPPAGAGGDASASS